MEVLQNERLMKTYAGKNSKSDAELKALKNQIQALVQV